MNSENRPPSVVRYVVVGVTTLSAVLLYLDRYCLSFAARFIKDDLWLTDDQVSLLLSAFFWTYGLGQVPAGWLGDRFGARVMLTAYILSWSLFTYLLGLTGAFAALLAFRFAFGLAQAGAYPVSASLLNQWMPLASRGRASSVVALGGRVGGFLAPVLTAYLIPSVGWRGAMLLYGVVGVLVALSFWGIFRDRPDEHRWCNAAETAFINAGRLPGSASSRGAVGGVPWNALLRSLSLWLNCVMQVGTNVGWVFIVTLLPRYLEEVHEVPTELRGWMTGMPIFVGCFGMLFGGGLTDWLVGVVGLRRGRSLPVVGSRLVAMAAYLACLLPLSPWSMTVAFSVVALATDLGIPAVWAFQQDVGGRYVGSVLGWGNMWGNVGAALSPLLLNWLVKHAGWDAAFLACAAGFLLSGVAALGIDATKPIDDRDAEERAPTL